MNGNLYCIFSAEKYSVIRKRGRQVEVVSKFHPNFLGLNVRRDGPQPSIFVRSFSQITTPNAPVGTTLCDLPDEMSIKQRIWFKREFG